MRPCPVCDHPLESVGPCQRCGVTSVVVDEQAESGASALPGPPFEGLELSHLPPLDVALEPPLEGLEPSKEHVAVASAAEPRPDWLEPSLAELEAGDALAPAPAPAGLLDLDRGREERAERSPAPAGATCRYCHQPAAPGEVFCARCGLRVAPLAAAVAPPAERAAPCRFCGAPAPGARCAACGARSTGEAA